MIYRKFSLTNPVVLSHAVIQSEVLEPVHIDDWVKHPREES